MKMNQKGMDRGERHESGEREPKGATSSDMSGERREGTKNGVGMGKADRTGVDGGVGRPGHMGKHDGRLGEYNDGNKGERECYSHTRNRY